MTGNREHSKQSKTNGTQNTLPDLVLNYLIFTPQAKYVRSKGWHWRLAIN